MNSKRNPIVDAHFDLLCDLSNKHQRGEWRLIKDFHLPILRAGGVNVIGGAIYVEDSYLPEMALRQALDQLSAFYQEMDDIADEVCLCRTYEEILDAIDAGKIAVILTMEGVEPLYNDIDLLRIFYELGVRSVTLTHSRRNYAANGCMYREELSGTPGGLTDFGVRLLKLAHQLGILIDLSHLNEVGFWDAMKFSESPVILSHSNPRALCDVSRNVTDDQIRAVAEKKGIICINSISFMLDVDPQKVNLSRYLDHIEYVANLVGIDFVGLGFDFCEHIMQYLSEQERSRLPEAFAAPGIASHADVGNIRKGLLARGFTELEVTKIMGGNYLRVFREVIG
jgi:membrane dipeptidase